MCMKFREEIDAVVCALFNKRYMAGRLVLSSMRENTRKGTERRSKIYGELCNTNTIGRGYARMIRPTCGARSRGKR